MFREKRTNERMSYVPRQLVETEVSIILVKGALTCSPDNNVKSICATDVRAYLHTYICTYVRTHVRLNKSRYDRNRRNYWQGCRVLSPKYVRRYVRTHERTCMRTDGRTDGRTHGRTDGWKYIPVRSPCKANASIQLALLLPARFL